MLGKELPDLYWTGGPFRVALGFPENTTESAVTKALEVIEEFRSDCQKQYCAFSGSVNGRRLAFEQFKSRLKFRKNTFFIGAGPPGSPSEQLPGKSTIAQIQQGEFLDSLAPGGAFEDQNAKAFLVMIFHLWDDHFRYLIAKIFSVAKDCVECDLMGDVRHVRNLIIHENSNISQTTFSAKLTILAQIWDLQPGKLRITDTMIHSLMEQLNALQVRIEAKLPLGAARK